jgi:hypothetical protein
MSYFFFVPERLYLKNKMALKLYRGNRWLILIIVFFVMYSLTGTFYKESRSDVTGRSILSPEINSVNAMSTSIPKNTEIHAAVVLSLSIQTSHIAEFYLLYDSWRFIQNFIPLSQEVIVDLIVFCEQPSCSQLPSSCLPLSYNKEFTSIGRCFHEELSTVIVKEWQQYLYMTSIAFMLTKEYREATVNYQWILRVDQDAVLSPGLLYGLKRKHVVKLYDMQFGAIGHGTDFTHERIRNIAKKLGYNHSAIHNLCSTWLVNPQDSIKLANLTTKIGRHFIEKEFGKNVSGIEDLPDIGSWPKWWRGVTSLYAADIAINHLYYPKLGHEHESSAIDHSAESGSSVWNAWQIHCLHNPGNFAKFRHRDELREFLKQSQRRRIEIMSNITVTQNVLKELIDEFHTIQKNTGEITDKFNGRVAVNNYAAALAWQKAYSALGAINL